MNKKENITVAQALEIFYRIQTPEIITVRDTGFALCVKRNYESLLPIAEEMVKLIEILEKLIEGKELKTEEDFKAWSEDKKNKEEYEQYLKYIEDYNKRLDETVEVNLHTFKVNNLSTKLSAEDLFILEKIFIS